MSRISLQKLSSFQGFRALPACSQCAVRTSFQVRHDSQRICWPKQRGALSAPAAPPDSCSLAAVPFLRDQTKPRQVRCICKHAHWIVIAACRSSDQLSELELGA